MELLHIGQDALLRGEMEKAQWAFNAKLYLDSPHPDRGDPLLWQRALSSFYSGHTRDGVEQLECDMSVNGNDVEEIVWHFLCRCKLHGFEKAFSDGFLSLESKGEATSSTSPPPMQEVLKLYREEGTVQDVLRAAVDAEGAPLESYNGTNALAYAHFYIGLWHEAQGELQRARHHLKVAADCKNPDYLGKVMGMHYNLMCLKFPSSYSAPPLGISDSVQHSKLIHGGWQLSKGHLIEGTCSTDVAVGSVKSLLRVVDAGVRVFDCGDIYTGVEELYGRLLRAHCLRGGELKDLRIHTKLVPDTEAIQSHSVDRKYVESIIRRSLNRLGLKCLHLVQFHWWDTSVPGYLEAVSVLRDLVQEGVIEKIGLTNFDAAVTKEFVDAQIEIASVQVQYSLLDRRPLHSGLVRLCKECDINILAYGVLAGGFLTDHWLNKPQPKRETLSNRSLVKYFLIIEEFGGWSLFQDLLRTLCAIADRHSESVMAAAAAAAATGSGFVARVSVAMVAIAYVLRQEQVKSVIIGAHSEKHLQSTVAAASLELTAADLAEIEAVLASSKGPEGPVYGLEREKEGQHASIMKYNLNQINRGSHLEEVCRRYLHLHFDGQPLEATRTGYRFSLHSLRDDEQLELPKKTTDSNSSLKDFDYSKTSLHSARAFNYDYSTGPCSQLEITEYCDRVKLLLREAEGIEREALSPDQLVDLTLITSQLKLKLLHWETIQMHRKDPAFYLPLNSILYLLPAWGPEMESTGTRFSSHPGVTSMSLSEKLLAILSRLRAIPNTLLQAHRNLTEPIELFVQTALEICGPFSSFLANTLPSLCGSLLPRREESSHFELLSEIQSAATVAAKCIQTYERFLRDNLLPKSSASVGVGEEAYDKILQYNHLTDGSSELLSLGEDHFTKVKEALASLAKEIDPTKSWQEVTTDLIRPIHPTSAGLLQAYMSEIERSRDHMISHDLISSLPDKEKVVGFSTPEFLVPFSPFGDYLNPSPFARMGTAGEHTSPAAEEDIPRVGHLMLHSVKALNLPEHEEQKLLRGHDYTWISVLAPHETYPGHHVQALLAQYHPRILRKYHESILFYEGWGLYTEQLAHETGFFNKEITYRVEGSEDETRFLPGAEYARLTRLTQLRLQLWRAARIILDVKLNTGKLSFEECCEFLHREVMFNQRASKGEVFMYASRPGYAPCYIAGFVMIMQLRRERQEKEGKSFKLKEFHNRLLSKGCIPFKLLSTLL